MIRWWRAFLVIGLTAELLMTLPLLQQPGQDRLLGVPTVLGLVPDGALRAVDHLGGDLLAAVGGQAVQHDRVRVGVAEQRRS